MTRMCLLSFFPCDVQPDIQALRNGSVTNDDGHGFAIITRDLEIITGHGMDFEEVVDSFATLRGVDASGPAIFHSRYTTHGSITVDNVHPYAVGRIKGTVLAHNGVLDASSQPRKGDLRSDTRILAEDLLWRRFPTLDSARTRQRFEKWLTSYNKVAVLTVNRRYRENAYLFNEKSGTWHQGVWYSNSGYQTFRDRFIGQWGRPAVYTSLDDYYRQVEAWWGKTDSWTAGDARETRYCDLCGHYQVSGMVCGYCRTCQGCYENVPDCVCDYVTDVDAPIDCADCDMGADACLCYLADTPPLRAITSLPHGEH